MIRVDFWLKVLAKSHANCVGLRLGGLRLLAKDVGKTVLGWRLALLGPVAQRAPAHGVHSLERSREVLAAWRPLFLPHEKEQVVASNEVLSNPFVSAEALKACEAGSSDSQSPALGDTWRYGCPKGPDWDDDVKFWTETEGTSSSEQCAHNSESLDIWSKTSQVRRFLSSWKCLGTCEGGSELPHGPGLVVTRNARGLVAGLLLPRGLLSRQSRFRSHFSWK